MSHGRMTAVAMALFILSVLHQLEAQLENANALGIPAIIIFGDSTVDAGNNNVFRTIMHSDHAPYGRDFGRATGRFSNGKLTPDFIAEKLNLPFPVAYTSPNATGNNLIQGINFASAASGLVDSTASLFNVASFTQQLHWFDDYRGKLVGLVGQQHAQEILSKALYVVSTGSNDYIYYRLNSRLSSQYNEDQFQTLLIGRSSGFLQKLYNAGARRIAVISLPPLGCLPTEITTAGRFTKRQCVDELNKRAFEHNKQLQQIVIGTRRSLPGSRVAYLDCYSVLFDAIHNPSKYGFTETNKGCCGSGLIEVGDACNALTPTCTDPSKYVFWDSFHPTEAMYRIIGDIFYSQAVSVLG